MLLTAELAQDLVDVLSEDLEIPEYFTEIDNNAFDGIRIDSLIIPDSVIEIVDDAFTYNPYSSYLRSVDLGEGVTTIGESAFAYSDITVLLFLIV